MPIYIINVSVPIWQGRYYAGTLNSLPVLAKLRITQFVTLFFLTLRNLLFIIHTLVHIL